MVFNKQRSKLKYDFFLKVKYKFSGNKSCELYNALIFLGELIFLVNFLGEALVIIFKLTRGVLI